MTANPATLRPRLLSALVVALLLLPGCSRRMVITWAPESDALVETEVIADAKSTPKIALIEVSGLIANARPQGLLRSGDHPLGRFVEALERARKDDEVRAVLVAINSPGGTVTASDLAYRELLRFREETGKPVVVLMNDYAASGGYYLACAGDELIANPTTVTGSIGVIFQTFDVTGTMAMIGMKSDAITSGPNKSMASPLEPMSAERRALLQEMIDEMYDGFVDVVRRSRPGLSDDVLVEVTDGRVVTGRRAAELGLVDGLGDLRDAFAAAKRRAGVERARLVKYHRPLEFVGSAYAKAPTIAVDLDMTPEFGFFYLWDPRAW